MFKVSYYSRILYFVRAYSIVNIYPWTSSREVWKLFQIYLNLAEPFKTFGHQCLQKIGTTDSRYEKLPMTKGDTKYNVYNINSLPIIIPVKLFFHSHEFTKTNKCDNVYVWRVYNYRVYIYGLNKEQDVPSVDNEGWSWNNDYMRATSVNN